MAYHLAPFREIGLSGELLDLLIDQHETCALPRLMRLWNYYRNALAEPSEGGASSGPPAQCVGLPARLCSPSRDSRADRYSREIVIENDIAWRIHTLVDFMFPASPRIVSTAPDSAKATQIEAALDAVFEASGGSNLWQDAALLGSVYAHVDFLVHGFSRGAMTHAPADETAPQGGDRPGNAPSKPISHLIAASAGRAVSIETVEAPRAIPCVSSGDYRRLDAYILHFQQPVNDVERDTMIERLFRSFRGSHQPPCRRATVTVTEIHSASRSQRYEDGVLVRETINRFNRVPVVHIQNISQPLLFEGLSDVEPLIPLQDELNTRLCDRANRVTMQSFRMWLGKGIDGFTERPIGPRQMWVTDNIDASIEAFGGDAESPSEAAHIEQLREALDKASGVTPAAAGHIKARVGNLTSENALRISLMGTIAKIKRKRITYGRGIAQLCELVLHMLDVLGILRTDASERGIDIIWADPIAPDESRRIADALAKAQLGIPLPTLRAELGYDAEPAAHTPERFHSSDQH